MVIVKRSGASATPTQCVTTRNVAFDVGAKTVSMAMEKLAKVSLQNFSEPKSLFLKKCTIFSRTQTRTSVTSTMTFALKSVTTFRAASAVVVTLASLLHRMHATAWVSDVTRPTFDLFERSDADFFSSSPSDSDRSD